MQDRIVAHDTDSRNFSFENLTSDKHAELNIRIDATTPRYAGFRIEPEITDADLSEMYRRD